MSSEIKDNIVNFDARFLKGAILRLVLQPAMIDKYREYLYPEMFDIGDENQSLFRIAKVLLDRSKNEPVSMEALLGWLNLQPSGDGRDASMQLAEKMRLDADLYKFAQNDGYFAEFLRYLKAQTFINSHKSVTKKFKNTDFDSAYRDLEVTLSKIKSIGTEEEETVNWETAHKFLEENSQKRYKRFKIGITDFDTMAGFEEQSMNLFISTSGGGKSMMSIHLIVQAVRQQKHVHAIFVEDRQPTILRRLYANMTGIPINELSKYTDLSQDKKNAIRAASVELQKYVTIDFVYQNPPSSILQKISEKNRERRNQGLPENKVVIIDYIQHIGHMAPGDSMHEKLHRAMADFKDFCLKHHMIGFTHFQVNRSGAAMLRNNDENQLIDMSMISGSYNACFVADNIISINRTPQMRIDNEAVLYVIKGREGCNENKYKVKTDFAYGIYRMETAEKLEDVL